jgi:hypothetical protein
MGYFAKINNYNYVTEVHSVMNDVFTLDGVEFEYIGINFLNSIFNTNVNWKQTSYNTSGGVYYLPNTNIPSEDQTKAFRKNYAGIGYTYDEQRDAFIPPKPFPSWILNEFSCLWESPVQYPNDGNNYYWDETMVSWVVFNTN